MAIDDALDRAPVGIRRALLASFVAAAVLAACSDDDGGDAAAAPPSTTAPPSTAAAEGAGDADDAGDVEVEAFEGPVEDFYRVPDPLPAGAPGDLIRTMPIDAPEGEAGLRIMYHSTDADGDDRAVTGVVHWPLEAPPDGGWPIVAWAHGTSGLAPQCAPSRNPGPSPTFGVRGVRVATDYLGLGPDGELHPYLSAAAEGHAVIDGVAAARNLPEAGAGDRWLLAGVSQGGHAALVSMERAAERLPDVELLGTVAVAPGSQLGETYGDEVQTRVITAMVLAGVAAEDPSVEPADYLSPDALAAAAVIEEGCLGEVIDRLLALAASPDFFTVDLRSSPVGQAWVAENDPGQVAADSPLLLVQGGQDGIVVPARTAALLERLCRVGQVVETVDVPHATHDDIVPEAADQIEAWMAARLAGDPPTDVC